MFLDSPKLSTLCEIGGFGGRYCAQRTEKKASKAAPNTRSLLWTKQTLRNLGLVQVPEDLLSNSSGIASILRLKEQFLQEILLKPQILLSLRIILLK